ncbi:DegV family protein [Clostridium gasigenes]|uniref:DegV family protein n=1 Tax=Clostridium gasigenes TaxID=94869 RepID=A0A7X0VPI9_9CLOT|nr:DegV family protein [Clostridium gasigenes]MBB6713309.1 DegV family protein [Clostridium gasigenes]MBU3133751.1 DegV family protein [Clostridium gasigenes]MBU3136838.1 DegV family protein [Clostridium gasigenes]
MAVRILTDSTSYIEKNIESQLDIKVISLNVIFGNESFKERDIDNEVFYKMMEEKGIPTSSQPSVQELYDEMEKVVQNGDSILCIFISSHMSGTYSTAHMVKELILESYKNAKIEIVDSTSNCMQLGFSVIVAARAALEGKNLDQVKEIAEDNIKRSRFLFVPDTLKYLKKGGRIGSASALIGNLLKIIPILTVEDGVTTILTKVRTKKKAVATMTDKMFNDIEQYGVGEITVHHINAYDEALELIKTLEEKLKIKIGICSIGPVIGTHVGPGTIAVAYYTEKNMR